MPSTTERPAPTQPAQPGQPRQPRRPHAVERGAWKVFGSLVAFSLLLLGACQLALLTAHKRYTVVEEYAAATVDAIEVHNGADGRVSVIGSDDTDVVKVTARVDDGFRKTGQSQRMEGTTLVLDSSCPLVGSSHCEVRYTVETPSDVNVLVRTDSGRVSISDIDGNVDARTDSSGMELNRIGGNVVADNDSGAIDAIGLSGDDVDVGNDSGHIRLVFEEAPRRVVTSNDSALIEIVVPEDETSYRVVTSNDSGSISVGVVQDPSSDRLIEAENDSAAINIRYG